MAKSKTLLERIRERRAVRLARFQANKEGRKFEPENVQAILEKELDKIDNLKPLVVETVSVEPVESVVAEMPVTESVAEPVAESVVAEIVEVVEPVTEEVVEEPVVTEAPAEEVTEEKPKKARKSKKTKE